ncbi:MAG: DUF3347 domain-containing protein [Saprospiraceae bacterium]|nr:DUF3347 domain-containing protein [Saprospiraceae bacterium]
MKKTILSLSLLIPGLGAIAQHDHAMHQKSDEKNSVSDVSMAKFKSDLLTTSYGYYLDIKNALVASDQKTAATAASSLQNSAKEINDGAEIAQQAAIISGAASLNDQRIAFTELSNEMTLLLKKNELSSGAIYLEFCPMANNSKGGYWLSNEKEIKNPYFGDSMLKCGEVKEIID